MMRYSTTMSALLVAATTGFAHGGSVLVERGGSGNQLIPGLNKSAYMSWDTGSRTGDGLQLAGPFGLVVDGDWVATFCVELDQHLSLPSGGEMFDELSDLTAVGFSGTNALLAESLFEQYYAVASEKQAGTSSYQEKVQGVAFQALLWELLIDGSFDLEAGDYLLQGYRGHGFTNSVLSEAQAWYATLDASGFQSSMLRLAVLSSDTQQDQVYLVQDQPDVRIDPIPTPVAAGTSLIGAGLLLSRRRRG